jgi:hypothetical protein
MHEGRRFSCDVIYGESPVAELELDYVRCENSKRFGRVPSKTRSVNDENR